MTNQSSTSPISEPDTKLLRDIAENAARLAADARVLFYGKRFHSAISLSVLSLEESGKFQLLRGGSDPNSKSLRSHFEKQKKAAIFHVEAIIIAFFDVLKEHGYLHKPYSAMTPRERWWLSTDTGQQYQKDLCEGRWPADALERVGEIVASGGAIGDYALVQAGKLDHIKQAGFYIDSAGAYPLPTNEGDLCAMAERWLSRAESMAQHVLAFGSPNSSKDYFATVLRDDLIRDCPF